MTTTVPEPAPPPCDPRRRDGPLAPGHRTSAVDLLGFLLSDSGRTDRLRQLLCTALLGAAGLLVLSVLAVALLGSGSMLPMAGAALAVAHQRQRRRRRNHGGSGRQ